MRRRAPAAFAALALAAAIAPASAAGLPHDDGEACHASALAFEKDHPDAKAPQLPDDPACRAFAAAFTALTGGAAPTTADAVLDALSLYGEPVGHGPAVRVDPARLESLLTGIREANDKPPETAWQRFVRWLQSTLDQQERQDRQGANWLRWLDDLPPELLRTLWWSLFTLMAGSLMWIVIRELEAADAFSRRPRIPRASAHAPSDAEAAGRVPTLAEVAGLPLSAQAAALLKSTIAQLRRTRRLPADDSLTNGELRDRLEATDPEQRRLFGDIVRTAEAQVYGGTPPPEARMRALIDDAARSGLAA